MSVDMRTKHCGIRVTLELEQCAQHEANISHWVYREHHRAVVIEWMTRRALPQGVQEWACMALRTMRRHAHSMLKQKGGHSMYRVPSEVLAQRP